jgi:hypothetical protein
MPNLRSSFATWRLPRHVLTSRCFRHEESLLLAHLVFAILDAGMSANQSPEATESTVNGTRGVKRGSSLHRVGDGVQRLTKAQAGEDLLY